MQMFAGTRKGLFRYERDNGRWRLQDEWFLGDAVPALVHDARDGALYVAVEHGHFGSKLHRCSAQGQWQELDPPRYPPRPEGVAESVCPMRQIPIPWSLEKIWSLATGGAEQPGVLWCGTIPGGLFRSDDHGQSWQLDEGLWNRPERARWFGGGYDFPGIHSIAVNPQDSDDIVIAVSCGGVWRTLDGGGNWKQMAHGMFYDFDPDESEPDPENQDPHSLVRCAADPEQMWSQHHCGIFRWLPDKARWQSVSDVQPSAFGFAVAVHPKDPDTAWFVPAVKDEFRYPVDGKLVVSRTRDGGQTVESLSRGLPSDKAYDLIYRHGLAVNATGETLAMGSTTGSLWVSENAGDDWLQLSAHLPPVYCLQIG